MDGRRGEGGGERARALVRVVELGEIEMDDVLRWCDRVLRRSTGSFGETSGLRLMVRVRGLVFCNSGEPIRVGGMGGD